MNEVSFDAIVAASEQAIDLWSKSQECQSCPSRVNETLLGYGKLVDLLEGAIVTYASFIPRLPDTEASIAAIPSSQQNGQQDNLMIGSFTPPATPGIVCLPSAMSLGEHELDEQQSRHLALDLIGRKLKSLTAILHQMRHQEAGESNEMRSRADATFSRVLRLLSRVTTALSSS